MSILITQRNTYLNIPFFYFSNKRSNKQRFQFWNINFTYELLVHLFKSELWSKTQMLNIQNLKISVKNASNIVPQLTKISS